MSEDERPVTEEDIHRLVDGQLDANRREVVERHLMENGADAGMVTAYRHQNRLLREAFDSILEERVPEHIVAAAAAAARPVYTRPRWAIAAGLALFIAGGAAGWFAQGAREPEARLMGVQELRTDAIAAHAVYTPEVRHPVEVTAAEQDHLVQWLSKRLGHQLKTPHLNAEGFDLVGGRLLPSPDGSPAAQFMYQDKQMRRLTLYVRAAEAGEHTAFRYARENDNRMFYWIDAPLAYALVGAIEQDELQKISTAVYDQLSQ
jgi:anti-sigma factor RsiW